MKNEKEEVEYIFLTRNVLRGNKTVFGFKKQNLREAVVLTGLEFWLVGYIPFTDVAMFFVRLVLSLAIFVLTLRGINKRSLVQSIISEIQFRKNRRITHLRGPEYVKKKTKSRYADCEDESIAERFYRESKEYIRRFIEQYGEEESSKNS